MRYGPSFGLPAKEHTVCLNVATKHTQKAQQRTRDQIAGESRTFCSSYLPLPRHPGLSFEERELLLDDADVLDSMPPGEEGMFMSNAGSIDEVYDDVLDQFHPKR